MIISQKYYSEGGAFEVTVRQHVAKHATKTRAEWAQEICSQE
jgi:hypothetical protein